MPKLKRSIFAVLWSLLWPGLGQIYLGKIKRGVIFLVCNILIQVPLIYFFINSNTKGSPGFLKILIFLFYLYAAIDSFRTGNRTEGLTFWKRCLVIYLLIWFLAFGNALYVRTYYIQPFKVPSAAMSPTIIAGDHIFVDKRIYKTQDPQRGDIIVFIFPPDRKKDFIKRIVALPNETLEIKDGSILINGLPIKQPEVFNRLHYFNRGNYGAVGQVVNVPPGYYFVLGDNSASSYDSRYWGFLPKSDIIGKAYKIFAPDGRSGPV